MSRHSPYVMALTRTEHAELTRRARKQTLPHREVVRAKIVLLATSGLRNDEIAARLDTSDVTVTKWRKRFFEERLPGLEERPRPGRPRSFSP